MKRRVNRLYRYQPVGIDRFDEPYDVEPNDIVRVFNMPGCPISGLRDHCHVKHLGGEFGGLVHVNSLVPLTDAEKRVVRRVTTRTAHRIASTRFNLDIVRDSQTVTQQDGSIIHTEVVEL